MPLTRNHICYDLAFIIDNKLIILVEHQSTINPNMPVRMLCYLAKEYEREECEAIREEDGYVRGMIDGKQSGMLEQKRISAEKLKAMKMPLRDIAQVTGLSEEEIQAL